MSEKQNWVFVIVADEELCAGAVQGGTDARVRAYLKLFTERLQEMFPDSSVRVRLEPFSGNCIALSSSDGSSYSRLQGETATAVQRAVQDVRNAAWGTAV